MKKIILADVKKMNLPCDAVIFDKEYFFEKLRASNTNYSNLVSIEENIVKCKINGTRYIGIPHDKYEEIVYEFDHDSYNCGRIKPYEEVKLYSFISDNLVDENKCELDAPVFADSTHVFFAYPGSEPWTKTITNPQHTPNFSDKRRNKSADIPHNSLTDDDKNYLINLIKSTKGYEEFTDQELLDIMNEMDEEV